MHSGSTYCVGFSGLLKNPLQAIEWDVEPLDPRPSLQICSTCWIGVWCLYLRAGRTPGNGARGCWHSSGHLLSISWLNFHCWRETESALQPPLFPSDLVPRGEVYCVRRIREEVMRVRCRSWLGGSLGCGQKEEGKKFTKKLFFFFFFFPLSLNCNRSDTQKKPSWELAQTSADICLTTFDTAGWRVKTSLCPNGYVWRIKKTCEEYRFESFRKQINSKTSPVPHPPILPLKPEQIKEGTFTAAATVLPGRRDGGHLCYFPALSLGGEEKTTRLSLRWTPIMVKRMITPTTGCWTMLTRMRIPLLLLSWAEKDKHRSNNKRESWADLTGEVR